MNLRDWLTAEAVAVEADGSVASVWRWVKAGLLPQPTPILGRALFKAADVKALVERRRDARPGRPQARRATKVVK